ncbi:MAG: glutathione S-transferase family protein [Gemmobacter sp.]
MLTIYGCYRSRATRPLWLLGEAGAAFDHVPVIQAYRLPDPQAPDAPLNTASRAFLAVNPLGQIPAMAEDGLVLTESLGIVLYLAKRHGGDLGPRDLAEDAQMVQWTLLAATAVEPAAVEMLMSVMAGQRDTPEGAARMAAAAERLARPLARIEAHLGEADWLVGGRFTAADINLAECLRYAQTHPTLIGGYPAVGAWLARCQARPAFAAMMAAREAEPA